MLHRVGGQFMRRERQDLDPVIAEGESWDLIAQHQAQGKVAQDASKLSPDDAGLLTKISFPGIPA